MKSNIEKGDRLITQMYFCIYFQRIVPESPRWFATRGQFDDAEKVLRRMAAVNGRELPEMLNLQENRKDVRHSVLCSMSVKLHVFDISETMTLNTNTIESNHVILLCIYEQISSLFDT